MRNFEMENKIDVLLDHYREKLPRTERGWLAISGTVDLSRNAPYDIKNSENDVRRDTVILLGLALEMSLEDFNTIMNYKGFLLRSFNYRDLIIADFIERRIYDTELINSYLIACNEEPLFNHKRSIS